MKIIGLYGIEKQDIIIILAKSLVHLGNKVLLLDATEQKELISMLQTEEKSMLMEYQGIYFMEADQGSEVFISETMQKKGFDVIFLDMGFRHFNNWEPQIGRRFYFCDQQRHHWKTLSGLIQKEDPSALFFFRDVIPCKLIPDQLLKEYGFEIRKDQLFVSYAEDGDGKYKLLCQYDPASYYSRYSASIQNFVCIVLQLLHPELTEIAVKRICRKAEKEDKKR